MKKNISHKSATSNQEIIDSCDFLSNAASTQDCTGLIPSGPMHFSRIEYSKGGEKRHWTFAETQFGPEPQPLMELLAERA